MRRRGFKGFTLVELIVVIAVIGVLAGILVPTMMGYVKKAKIANANSAAKSLYNATMSALREADVSRPVPDGIFADSEAESNYPSTYDGDTLRDAVYRYAKDLRGTRWAILVEEDCVSSTMYMKTASENFLGTFPTQMKDSISGTTGASSDVSDALNYAKNGTW
ncbi:MAG: type II secretion system protein [Oscillospiraceae bacterium]|nr:type II secretion system protein [Oscillospiraceae bacterium]